MQFMKQSNMIPALVAVLIAAFFLAGCGSDDSDDSDDTGASVIMVGSPLPGDRAEDPFTIGEAVIEGDTLHLSVSYKGGCREHGFDLLAGSFLESNPVQVDVMLSHNAHGDTCGELISEELAFDLSPLKYSYQKTYLHGRSLLVIRFRDSIELEYNFGGDNNDTAAPVITVSPPLPGDWAEYPFILSAAVIEDDTLHLSASYKGGCEKHEFTLLAGSYFMESNPVQADVMLSHNAHGDTCGELIRKELAFDLSPLRYSYQETYPNSTGPLLIRFRDLGEKQGYFRLEYNFDSLSTARANQRLARVEKDYENDGVTDAVTTHTYDADGNRVRVENIDDRNPLADSYVYTYDVDGNVVSEEISEFPRDIVLWAVSHTYDSDGNVTRTEYDSLADGTVDEMRAYTYDDHGNMTREDKFYNNDGEIRQVTRSAAYTYDADGNIVREELEKDYGADGTADWTFVNTYEYNDRGELTRETRDETLITVFTYDDEGRKTGEEWYNHGNGTDIDGIVTFSYDADGNLAKKENYSYTSEKITEVVTYTYDADGNMIREETDSDGDGTPDSVIRQIWEAAGESSV